MKVSLSRMSDYLPPRKPWSVDQFQSYRRHVTDFVDTNIVPLVRSNRCSRIVLHGPVKGGKREIAEYTALRDAVTSGQAQRVHAFTSAWHRTADDDQRSELKQHNLHVFSIISKEKAIECIRWIKTQIENGRDVVIHLDECDHGSGVRQLLGRVWREIRENNRVTVILYSATPEEVLYSDEIDSDSEYDDLIDTMMNTGHYLKYTPPSAFCGPARFLDENLVRNAMPFFQGTSLTPQGREICTGLRECMSLNPRRNMVFLRLSYSTLRQDRGNRKASKSIHQFLRVIDQIPELNGVSVLVDKDEHFECNSPRVLKERIQWSNPTYWNLKATGVPILIVADQTSTRSTEWAFHDRVYAEHDFRNIVQFGTTSQAQERVNHYDTKYGGFQPIIVYGSVKTFQLSAGRISYEEYLTNEWYSRKVDRRRSGDSELYEVKNTATGELHPGSQTPVTREESDRILQESGSYADQSLSARVRGSVRNVAIVDTTWHSCNVETFDEVSRSEEFRRQSGVHRFQNPFIPPQMIGDLFTGYLRERRVFQYSEVSDSRWGFNRTTNGPRLTVCYRDGVLGIALRTLIGFEIQNTLSAFRSMYRVRQPS